VNAATEGGTSTAFWFVDIILRTETNEVAIKVCLQHSIRFSAVTQETFNMCAFKCPQLLKNTKEPVVNINICILVPNFALHVVR